MSLFLDLALLATAVTHVWLSPFTKVEESFNLHATHDILVYGVAPSNLPNFDHFTFPGAVPRSFVGSLLLAWTTTLALRLQNLTSLHAPASKADLLLSARIILAVTNALGLAYVRRAVSKRFGFLTGAFFVALTCTQFHLPYWMGRTLPNMFALFPVNLAYAFLLKRAPNTARPTESNLTVAIALLTFASVVFRAEIALLLAPIALQALLARWISFSKLFKTGLIAGFSSMFLTITIDSYFWDTLVWPELNSIYFNVYEGKSAEWGVSPFHTYATSYLPKLLTTATFLSVIGFLSDSRIRSLLRPLLAFILLISFLGHKEWRFIVYSVPLFNVAAARGLYWLSKQRVGTLFGKLSLLIIFGCFVFNVLVTYIMTQASMSNYPGGAALTLFNNLYRDTPSVHVHIDNLAAQTGASLFLHIHAPPFPSFLLPNTPPQTDWIYNKTENLTPKDIEKARHFTHAITERPREFGVEGGGWRVVECVRGFDGFGLERRRFGGGGGFELPVPEFKYVEKLCIVERN